MYSNDYIVAAALFFAGIVLLGIKAGFAKETTSQKSKAIIRLIIVVISTAAFAVSLIWDRHVYIMKQPDQIVKAVNEKHHDDFTKEFSLGYRLFGVANKQFFPFQGGPTDTAFLVHWEKQNYSWSSSDDTVTLHLPDIDFLSNMMLRGTTVVLPEKVGNSITLRLDPKSFQHGAAIVSNVFERTEEREETVDKGCNTSPSQSGVTFGEFPGPRQIVYLMQATIRWSTTDCYEVPTTGVGIMGNLVKVTGGTLRTSRVDVFDDTELINGNTFIGGPRGGYGFPKAGTVIGNVFSESIFDASRIPDRAIIANNRFISTKGVYRIGPQPDISFVVKIVQTGKDGAVLLFGAKPYSDDEGP